MTSPVWFITGCSTGFGRELARLVLERGWRAVVTAREKERVTELLEGASDRALALSLDVTDPAQIVAAVEAAMAATQGPRDLEGETVLITAGGTREPIDGVRFLGNRSSGRMGYALADEALSRGAKVILVSASVALSVPPGAELIKVITAAEMRVAVLATLPRATIVLKAAAVADFRPVHVAPGKLQREGKLLLELEPTEDIVAEVVGRRARGTLVVAFAAEIPNDGDALPRARQKMRRKGVDAMVVNDVSAPGIGFDAETNAGTLLVVAGQGERAIDLPHGSKRRMASRIFDELTRLRLEKTAGFTKQIVQA